MQFTVDQLVPGTVEDVVGAFTDPGFLASISALATIGDPEILDQERAGDLVRQRIRYRFTGDLSPMVTALVDRNRLVWVDEHEYDLKTATATFRIVPDHFADRLRCSGTERFEPAADGGTDWHVEADLGVRWPVVGPLVERAIVSGLRETLAEEVALVARWLDR